MSGQTEASTPTVYNDLVREVAVTPTGTGVAVKQQVVVLGDPLNPEGLLAVSTNGELYIRAEALENVMRQILASLRQIHLILADGFSSMNENDILDEEATA